MALTSLTKKISAELAGRLDKAVRALSGKSHTEMRGLLSNGCVSVNGELCDDGATLVNEGDTLAISFDPHRKYKEGARAWEDDDFKIVFEDKFLIVVDKAAGVLTVPARTGDTNSLMHSITKYFDHKGLRARAQLVHRLDRGASGLLVFGKSREIAAALQSQFEGRKPEREYAAIVKGIVPEEGTIESYLDTTSALRQFSTDKPGEGQLAITHFKLVKMVHGCSWLRVWLETGRRNQIRVHFAEKGHPVLGDAKYQPMKSNHPKWRAKRLALHAGVLGFEHPVTGKELRFEAPMPAGMKAFVK